MNRDEYAACFEGWVRSNLDDWYEAIRPWYLERGAQWGDSLSYFRAHLPRFWAMIEMLEGLGVKPTRAAEVGSFYPYTARYWDCPIDLYDIMPRIANAAPYSADGVTLYDTNLCTEPFNGSGYDLVILSEVMEHLPCDLFALERRVIDIMTPGGVLLVTYPMHGHNAKDYGAVLGDQDELHHEHVREFTDETAPLFFKALKLLEVREINYPAYGRIHLVAYRKEAPCP